MYITHDQAEAFALADVIGVLDQGRLVQLADPETLYLKPANPFVARFTGLSGELGGSVVGRDDEEFFVIEVGSWRVRARSAHALKAGDAVRVLIRPAATAFDESAASDDESAVGTVSGSVIDVAYRGRGYDHVVACGEHHLTSVFSARPWVRGTQAKLSLDPTGCLAFPLNDAARISYDEEVTAVMAGSEPAASKQGVTE